MPHPEQIVAEMVALVRPGGIVALYEADWLGSLCDPPLRAWNRLLDLLHAYSSMNGIDLFIGRKIPRILREAGLTDIQVNPLIRVSPQGHGHRTILLHFVENLRERLLAQKLIADDELTHLLGS